MNFSDAPNSSHGSCDAHGDDAALVRAAIQGQKDCFEKLVELHHRRILGLSRLWLRDLHGAEDVAQETFVRAYRQLANCREPERFSTWLVGIARNCMREWLRKQQRIIPMADLDDQNIFTDNPHPAFASPHEEAGLAEREARLVRLEKAIAELPEEIRQVLMMKYRQNNTCAEIALHLNKKTNTVAQMLSRAYERLEQAILQQERVVS